MEMLELDIEMTNDLVAKVHNLAQRYFGNDDDPSLSKVLEVAFNMRYLLSHSIEGGHLGTDEVVTDWEVPKSTQKPENSDCVREWLFRR